MFDQVQITLRRIERSPALEKRIRALVARLERRNHRILSCRVLLEAPHQGMHQGGHYVARLDILCPGCEIVVNRDHHQDAYVALRDAFSVAGRQLAEHARRRSGKGRARARAAGMAGE